MSHPATITISVTGLTSGSKTGMVTLRRELTSAIMSLHHVTKKTCATFQVNDMNADACVRLIRTLYEVEKTFKGIARIRRLKISGHRDINVDIPRR